MSTYVIKKGETAPKDFLGKYITEDELKSMIEKYRIDMPRQVLSASGVVIDDAKCCWFSWQEIQDFISDNQKLTGEQLNGVRIYYGIHPEKTAEIGNMHNVILVTTYDKKDSGGKLYQQDFVKYVSIAGSGAYDNGTLCPPLSNCPGADYVQH